MHAAPEYRPHRSLKGIGPSTCIWLLILWWSLMACSGGGSAVTGQQADPTAVTGGNAIRLGTHTGEMTLQIHQLVQEHCPRIQAYVSVTDADGRPVEALSPSNFAVFSGGELSDTAQVQWVPAVAAPLSVAFVMDYSGPARVEEIGTMEMAVARFVDRMGEDDWGEVIKFAALGEVVQAFTQRKRLLQGAIVQPWPQRGSPPIFYDAVQRAVADTARRDGRRAVVAISDGEDRLSRQTLDGVIAFAVKRDVPVFTIGVGRTDAESLFQLAAGTGGRYFHAPNALGLADTLHQLHLLLERQYRITYGNGGITDAEHILEVIVESDRRIAGDILPVSGCSDPSTVEMALQSETGGPAHQLDRDDGGRYLSGSRTNTTIADGSAQRPPLLTAELATLAAKGGFAVLDAALATPYAFIAAGAHGLVVAEMRSSDGPRIVATVTPDQIRIDSGSRSHLTAITEVAVHPPFLFALDSVGGLVTFRFQDPQHIYYRVEPAISGNRLWKSGHHLYITTATGLSIYDIRNPSAPTLVGQALLEDGTDAISLAYPSASVASAKGQGAAVIDVSREFAPRVLGELAPGARPFIDEANLGALSIAR
ncbi:MAG: hypothetical protein QNJ22_08825 [Desulfosarcinaceae bacterium]|nr:hypothetical protein [Desulfosarcinaceae bacterium]